MSRSLIQTVNAGPQTVPEMGVIGLGSTTRRFGCNLRQVGDAIEAVGCGYYTIVASVVAAPDVAGVVSVAAYQDGVQITGAVGSSYVATPDNPTTIPLVGTIRLSCEDASSLTFVLVEGSGTVENVTVQVKKA